MLNKPQRKFMKILKQFRQVFSIYQIVFPNEKLSFGSDQDWKIESTVIGRNAILEIVRPFSNSVSI